MSTQRILRFATKLEEINSRIIASNATPGTAGAFYLHGPADSGATPKGVVIDGCTFIAQNNDLAISLPDVSGSTSFTDIDVTIRRTICATNGTTAVGDGFKATHKLTKDSALNNNALLNY